jgi:streptomycin 6-kinase
VIDLPDIVRRRAEQQGEPGKAWLGDLDRTVADLATAWSLTIGPVMSGGTEALVLEVNRSSGAPAVLKLPYPGADPTDRERRVFQAAAGRGYATLLAHDPASRAMLLERLGPMLDSLGLALDDQMVAICQTLRQAWTAALPTEPMMTGPEKAADLAAFIEATWQTLDHPCPEPVIAKALAYTKTRAAAHEPARCVLAHGDAHGWNTLADPTNPGAYKFVDPDGLIIEPAYDLAIPMREWSDDLLIGDPLERGRARCRRLAQLTGLSEEPIWQWGYIERVSTGLACLQLGLPEGPAKLAVAEAWSQADGGP